MKLEDVFYYDETSPSCLRWKIKREIYKPYYRLLCSEGDVAGKQARNGYWVINARNLFKDGEKESLPVHRVILMLLGQESIEGLDIDHIDGDPSNNCLSNLRAVTRALNCRNRRGKDDSVGNGVSLCRKKWANGMKFTDYWLARITSPEGKRLQKNFSISQHGEEAALILAQEWYDSTKTELNKAGAGYTDRHMT